MHSIKINRVIMFGISKEEDILILKFDKNDQKYFRPNMLLIGFSNETG